MSAASTEPRRGVRAASRVRLRADIFEARTKILGAENETTRAELVGMDRTNLLRIRNGQSPSLELAMHMATVLGLTVEQLFEVVPDA